MFEERICQINGGNCLNILIPCKMYDELFVPLSCHKLQICSNCCTTTATSGPRRCEAVLHGCQKSLVGGGGGFLFVVVYILTMFKVT